MNKKEKMICKMWKNYTHNCSALSEEPLYNFKIFKNAYISEDLNYIWQIKNWYRDVRIKK